jgi:HEAT repeat protein
VTAEHPTAASAVAAALAEPHPDARAAHVAGWLGFPRRDELHAALRVALAAPQAETRRRAVLIAAAALPGTAFRDELLAALADSAWGVREAAAVALAHIPDAAVCRRLVTLTLHDPGPLVRRAAAAALGPRIDPARDYAGAAAHRFERQRIRAADALGFAPHADAVALLTGMVTDPHPKVRAAALRALTRHDPAAVRPLLPLVVRKCAEAEPRVAAAARALRERLEDAP